jgi:hypothetical protein
MKKYHFLLGSVALVLSACLGPKPSVARVDLHPPEKGSTFYTLVAEVRNVAGGEGEISVEAKLTDRPTGKTYRAERKLHLASHETTMVTLTIEAPPSDYAPEVTAEYPPG